MKEIKNETWGTVAAQVAIEDDGDINLPLKRVEAAGEAVRLVEIDYESIEKRKISEIQENIRLRKEWENRD